MKLLIDTNVVLDVLLDRSPHAAAAAQVFALADTGRIEGAVCATTVTTVHYLAAKAGGRARAVRLLADLLDVFAVAPVDLAAAIPELLDRLRGGLAVDRVRLAFAPALPRVLADPARLERVLVNLLSNALKYSPPESEVVLGAAPAPEGVAIAVTDRGVGIAPEDQAHIFDRFFRARGARRPEGLGLGLYIARLLVEAHGGTVSAESGLGQGSTFRVVLPAAP